MAPFFYVDLMNEFSLIDKYFRPLTSGFAPALDLRDDAALLPVPAGQELVITKDLLISGVHFIGSEDPALIAQKSLRVNLSDLAAKGATPYAYSLGLALPVNSDCHPERSEGSESGTTVMDQILRFAQDDKKIENWLHQFSQGLAADQKQYNIHLLGGDTTRSNNDLMISITAYGLVPSGGMVKRSGAQPGDLIFVTGTIGDAGLGLKLLQSKEGNDPSSCHPDRGQGPTRDLRVKSDVWIGDPSPPKGEFGMTVEDRNFLTTRYLFPQPRMGLIAALKQKNLVHAAADISDGLLADLNHILNASKVGGRVELAQMPISLPAQHFIKDSAVSLSDLASMGDDYEIVFTALPQHREMILEIAASYNIPVTVCGIVTDSKNLDVLLNDQKLDVKKFGYEHSLS